MEESVARIVTDDDCTPIKNSYARGNVPEKLEELLVIDSRVDKEANNNNSEPLKLVKEMRADDNYYAQNIFYLPKPTADVGMVKIVLSACFAVDVDADNLRLRMRLPTQLISQNGRKKYKYITLNDNNQKLVEHPYCVDRKIHIFVSKNRNSGVWDAYLPEEADDYDDARKMLEDEWLEFVKRHWTTIDNVLQYNERIWHVGGEKIKFLEKYHCETFCDKVVTQIEGRRQRLHDLRLRIMKRQSEETEAIRSERYDRMNGKFFYGQTPRTA
jgi:hypothetical protein